MANPNPQPAPSLLAECIRQRSEIERLRAVVKSLAWCDPYPDDAGDAENTMNSLIEAARAALGDR